MDEISVSLMRPEDGRAELAGWFKPTEDQPGLFDDISPLYVDIAGGRLVANATGKQAIEDKRET